jgi:DNA-binding response OmpR family regulator
VQSKGVALFGAIEIDFDRMELSRSGRHIPATAKEFKVLEFLVSNPHFVYSREELIAAAWPRRRRTTARTVDNLIMLLRRKIEEDPTHPVYLQTVHGTGYKFVPFGWTAKAGATWCWGRTSDGRRVLSPPVLKDVRR